MSEIEEILQNLYSPKSSSKRWAIRKISEMGKEAATEEIIKALLAILNSQQDKNLRISCADALGSMGETAATEEIIQDLLDILNNKHEDCSVRGGCAVALGRMGETAATEEIIKTLLAILKNRDQDHRVRRSCAVALSSMPYTLFLIPNIIDRIPLEYESIIKPNLDKVEREYQMWLMYNLKIETDIPYIDNIIPDHFDQVFRCIVENKSNSN